MQLNHQSSTNTNHSTHHTTITPTHSITQSFNQSFNHYSYTNHQSSFIQLLVQSINTMSVTPSLNNNIIINHTTIISLSLSTYQTHDHTTTQPTHNHVPSVITPHIQLTLIIQSHIIQHSLTHSCINHHTIHTNTHHSTIQTLTQFINQPFIQSSISR